MAQVVQASVPAKVKPAAVKKGPRPPLERTFAQGQDLVSQVGKVISRLRAWSTQSPAPAVSRKLDEAIGDLQEAMARLNGIGPLCQDLAALGFRPAEVAPGLSPGDPVMVRSNVIDKAKAWAEKPSDLDHLVVLKVVGSDVVVGVLEDNGTGPTGSHRRFAVMPKGNLAPRKEAK